MPKPAARPSRLPAARSAYARFVAELKARIVSARLSAAHSVNRELILLYWDIGRAIADHIAEMRTMVDIGSALSARSRIEESRHKAALLQLGGQGRLPA